VTTPCVFCPEPGCERQHLTGRGPGGRYLDPGLWVSACPDCNRSDFHGWRVVGLHRLTQGVHVGRLRRIAWFCGRLGSLDRPSTVEPRVWAELARTLSDIADRLSGGQR
jgi:hypothetical protein